jgi:hypothetical protein
VLAVQARRVEVRTAALASLKTKMGSGVRQQGNVVALEAALARMDHTGDCLVRCDSPTQTKQRTQDSGCRVRCTRGSKESFVVVRPAVRPGGAPLLLHTDNNPLVALGAQPRFTL